MAMVGHITPVALLGGLMLLILFLVGFRAVAVALAAAVVEAVGPEFVEIILLQHRQLKQL